MQNDAIDRKAVRKRFELCPQRFCKRAACFRSRRLDCNTHRIEGARHSIERAVDLPMPKPGAELKFVHILSVRRRRHLITTLAARREQLLRWRRAHRFRFAHRLQTKTFLIKVRRRRASGGGGRLHLALLDLLSKRAHAGAQSEIEWQCCTRQLVFPISFCFLINKPNEFLGATLLFTI